MRLAQWIGVLSCFVSGLASAASIVSFSPQGSVKNLSQVQVRFDTNMVDFGHGRAPSPFDVDCPVRGAGRWLDAKTFVYDFVSELPGGIRCNFTLIQQKNLRGEDVSGERVFSFDTGGPALVRSLPSEGSTYVNESEPILLVFDAPVKLETLAGLLSFQIPQRADSIGFQALPDPEKYLAQRWPYLAEEFKSDPKFYLLIKPKERLPGDAEVTLVLDKGISSPAGIQSAAVQSLHFKTRPPFRAALQCTREKANGPCIPQQDVILSFNESVSEKERARIRIFDTKNQLLDVDRDAYSVRIPGPHAPNTSYRIEIPSDLKDEQDRALANAEEFPLSVKIGDYGPLLKFPGDFGVLESTYPIWPLNMRRVEGSLKGKLYKAASQPNSILKWYKTIQGADDFDKRAQSVFAEVAPSELKDVPLTKPNGPDAFEVVGVPLAGPGFYVMEVASNRLGKALLNAEKPMFARAAALVTNMAVHVKKGQQDTLVWVTSFDKGLPVKDAAIAVSDCKGEVLIRGRTDDAGVFIHRGALPRSHGSCYGSYDYDGESDDYMVSASKDGDFSFTLTHWTSGIESWRFQLPSFSEPSALTVHSILDRSLFRVGETVSMLQVARQRVKDGLDFPNAADLPPQMELRHAGSGKSYKLPLLWDKKARAESSWKIPVEAPLGWYSIMIKDQESGRFRVDEFRLASMRGHIRVVETSLVAPQATAYDFDVSFLSGGPAAQLPVRMRRSIEGAWQPRFAGYDAFDFEAGPVEREPNEKAKARNDKIESKDVTLDLAGGGTVSWPAPQVDRPTRVLAELEFPDANGEARTVAIEHKIFPAAVLIGMKSPSWMQKGDSLNLEGVVLDTKGQAVTQQEIVVRGFQEEILSHRRRGVGGTYVYEHKRLIKDIGVFCTVRSDEKGFWNCQRPLKTSGAILLQAEAKDKDGHLAQSHRTIWVAGERLWFLSEDHDRMDLIPEKRHYEVGETARLQVKMPFATATALIAVERDGAILESRVAALDAQQPFIEVPIARGYAPNVFVSVWAVRGRVKGTEPLLKIDLGKPAHKLGMTELKVGWKAHQLDVKVTSDKPIYKIRENVKAHIVVKSPTSQPLPADAIATVAVVDEALLELQDNSSWELLDSMMAERSYGMEHATSAMQVIGKRHFGLKALPQGGGGGGNPTREIFDSLIYWKARVPLNQGEADLVIPLKDNLSSFRVVAVAQAGPDLFGKGASALRTEQDIGLTAGLPPLVREGDKVQLLVTVRNQSRVEQQLALTGRQGAKDLEPKQLHLKAGAADSVQWPVTIPEGVAELVYTFQAKAAAGSGDSLSFTQQVKPALPLRVQQASLLVLKAEPLKIPIARPEKARAGQGGLDIDVSVGPGRATLLGTDLFFKRYPYTCLEQRVSRAVGLDDHHAWDQLMRELDSYLDNSGLLKFFPQMPYGSMTLTAYVLSLSQESGLALPRPKAEALRNALKNVVAGRTRDHEQTMPGDQLLYRKIMALEALTRYDSKEAVMIKDLDVHADLLPHATLIDLIQVLARYNSDEVLKQMKEDAIAQLQARLRLSGSQLTLLGEEYNSISSLMSSPDSNAARMLLMALKQNIWPQDHARMLEGFLRRQKQGAWTTTIANAWGTLAVKAYIKLHPPASSDSRVSLLWQGKSRQINPKDHAPVHLDWPTRAETLTLDFKGDGKGEAWATVIARAAVPVTEAVQSGYKLEKNLEPLEQKAKGTWSRGDIVRVQFKIEAGSDQTWVVMADPIPAGARILTSSLRAGGAPGAELELTPSYIERRHEGYFAYFDFMPAGKHTISYVMQLNNPGLFQLPSTRLEAMYAPDLYAELPNASFPVD